MIHQFHLCYLPKEIKTLIIKDMHVSVHCGIIFCSQDVKARDMEPRCPSIDEWRIHTHTRKHKHTNGILFSHKYETLPFVIVLMFLEIKIIMLNKMNQRKITAICTYLCVENKKQNKQNAMKTDS